MPKGETMSAAKFEKLIDYIVNEDRERAEQLFHEIVVEKSRQIYESLMDEDMTGDLMDEIESEETNVMEVEDEEMDFEDDEEIDGDFDTDGMDDMEADAGDMEADMDDMDADADDMEADMDDMEADMGDEVTKDDILNLEDKLDEIMARFEEEFGSEEEDEEAEDDELAAADDEMDAEEDEEDAEEDEEDAEEDEDEAMMESVQMKQVGGATYDKFGKMGDDGAQKRSPVAANAGSKGPVGSVVKPVKFAGEKETVPTSPKGPSNAYSKGEKMSGDHYQNSPGGAKGTKSGSGVAAAKPKSSVAEGKKAVRKRI